MDSASWHELKELIVHALKRAPAEREAYVRQRCAETEMLVDALSLLKHCESDPNPGAILPFSPGDKIDEFADLQPGTCIGQYVIVDRIGRGGMGQVFLGRDQELHRRVALKCLLSVGSNLETQRARIKAEARAAAAINHANVAAVHHVVEHGSRTFIVMEYVEGESLSARLKRGRLPIDRVLSIGRQLAAALKAAHDQGVIHGDLKPGNIQIKADGSIKVLDFGIARTLRMATSAPSGATTRADMRLRESVRSAVGGTPPYMSPEQLLDHAIDERSDVYSLGVVLFEMATGHQPFPSTDAIEMVHARVKGAPRADAVEADVPGVLGDVIARALEIDVSQRYQSALDVEAALDGVRRALERPKPVSRQQLGRWVARAVIAAPVVMCVIGALGVVKTLGFNNNFGRTGAFARFGVEPWPAYFRWGLLGIAPKLLVMTITGVIVMAARIVLRTLELIGPVGRFTRSIKGRGHAVAIALGLDKPSILAQALSALGIVLILGVGWYYSDLVDAFQVSFNSAPIERLLPMRESAKARGYYQAVLSVVTLVLCFGMYTVIQLRARQKTREGRVGVAMLAGVIAVTILMNEVPYRSFNYRDFERADFAGLACYIIGQSGDEFLLLCPGTTPPRNRTVKADDPRFKPLGIIENVFRGVNPAGSRP